MRLSFGDHGNVMVKMGGTPYWKGVCDDVLEDQDYGIRGANVICRMLGYERAFHWEEDSHFGTVEGGIGIDNLKCTGGESSIADCTYKTSHDCGHDEFYGVICA